jgi:hypothetical protein
MFYIGIVKSDINYTYASIYSGMYGGNFTREVEAPLWYSCQKLIAVFIVVFIV